MSAEPTKPSSPAPSPAPGSPEIDEQLHTMWQKYGQAALIACGLVLLFYIGKVGWDYWQSQRENSIQEEYAAAKTPAQWKAFAAAHPDHKLAGIADLQVADDAYAAGLMPLALTNYQAAQPLLKNDPLSARAKIGAAMAQLQTGQTAAGEAALRAIFSDQSQLPVVRTEAGYQIASLAANRGQMDEVRQLATQLFAIDQRSPWAQKAFMLRPPAK